MKNAKLLITSGTIVVLAVLGFVFFSFFAPKFGQAELGVEIQGKKLTVRTTQLKTSPESLTQFDPRTHYIDSARGFAFELPRGEGWSRPEVLVGMAQVAASKNWTGPLAQNLEQLLSAHPLGPLYRTIEFIRIVHGSPQDIEVTEETTNELLEQIVRAQIEEAAKRNIKPTPAEVKSLRSTLLGFDRIAISNEFAVNVYDKSVGRSLLVKPSLPVLFVSLAPSLGLNVDHIAANDQSILSGSSLSLQRVRMKGRTLDLQFSRWYLFAESKEKYFLVEIGYSPQIDSSINVWEQLRRVLDSFRVIGSASAA